jgi:hypothetical protein
VVRYTGQLDTADRRTAAGEDPSETVLLTKTRLRTPLKRAGLDSQNFAASIC